MCSSLWESRFTPHYQRITQWNMWPLESLKHIISTLPHWLSRKLWYSFLKSLLRPYLSWDTSSTLTLKRIKFFTPESSRVPNTTLSPAVLLPCVSGCYSIGKWMFYWQEACSLSSYSSMEVNHCTRVHSCIHSTHNDKEGYMRGLACLSSQNWFRVRRNS